MSICPATGAWEPVQNGAWDSKPTWNTLACTPGEPSADGTSMTWTLGTSFQTDASAYDIVLVPQGPVPFQIAIQQPGADALTGAGDTSSSTDSSSTVTDSAGATVPSDVSTFSDSTFVAPGPSGAFDLPAPAATPAPAAAGRQQNRTPASPGSPFPQAAGPIGDRSDNRAERIGAVVMLLLLGGMLWLLGGAPARPPRLLGSLGGGGGAKPAAVDITAPVRGIGRFARPRTTAPQRL